MATKPTEKVRPPPPMGIQASGIAGLAAQQGARASGAATGSVEIGSGFDARRRSPSVCGRIQSGRHRCPHFGRRSRRTRLRGQIGEEGYPDGGHAIHGRGRTPVVRGDGRELDGPFGQRQH